MSNDIDNGTFGQQPKDTVTIPGFAQYKIMDDLQYIQDTAGELDDMVASLSVKVQLWWDHLNVYPFN